MECKLPESQITVWARHVFDRFTSNDLPPIESQYYYQVKTEDSSGKLKTFNFTKINVNNKSGEYREFLSNMPGIKKGDSNNFKDLLNSGNIPRACITRPVGKERWQDVHDIWMQTCGKFYHLKDGELSNMVEIWNKEKAGVYVSGSKGAKGLPLWTIRLTDNFWKVNHLDNSGAYIIWVPNDLERAKAFGFVAERRRFTTLKGAKEAVQDYISRDLKLR
jgi:hypothetical protein